MPFRDHPSERRKTALTGGGACAALRPCGSRAGLLGSAQSSPALIGAVFLAASLGLAGLESLDAAENATEQTRGVRLLDPGDEMMSIAPFPELKPGFAGRTEPPPLDKIRLAVAGGAFSNLAGPIPRAAPFEIVAPSANPDLVWDAVSRNASAGGQVIAYDVAEADLPAVIDRMAVVRGLAKLAAARPQPMRIAAGGPLARKGDRIEIEIPDVLRRALVLFDIAGDGSVEALYPIGADPRVIQTQNFRWAFQIREPFGADVIVAISAAQPMDALVQGLKEISQHRSAGQVLKLIASAAPADARIGSVALSSAP
ncbi:hypothetical protein [Methylocapsa aurea]|uniref:hypothetical protein n=1 Tax=Methylocapsa aurea TaxID=663610 RepID=UPI0012EBF9DB|nr:hypothetical protein [Methylocapsa aurea]